MNEEQKARRDVLSRLHDGDAATAADAEARQASQSSRRVLQSVGRHRAVLRREDPFWADVGDRSLSSRFSDSAVALFHQTYPEFPSDGSGQ
jgi:hypothetical protein